MSLLQSEQSEEVDGKESRSQQEKITEAICALRAEGRRITPQRALILRILREQRGHLSADGIHALARRERPRLSLSTVYRTLDLLKALGLVKELRLDDERYHYEVIGAGEHQHLVCLGCGKVIEFQCAHCVQMHQDLADRHGFQITGSRVELLGYCAACRGYHREGKITNHQRRKGRRWPG